jgi:hypothetical protein
MSVDRPWNQTANLTQDQSHCTHRSLRTGRFLWRHSQYRSVHIQRRFGESAASITKVGENSKLQTARMNALRVFVERSHSRMRLPPDATDHSDCRCRENRGTKWLRNVGALPHTHKMAEPLQPRP